MKFDTRRQIVRHVARVHDKRYLSDFKPKTSVYKCDYMDCDLTFQTPGALNDHFNKHKGFFLKTIYYLKII